MSKRLLYGLLTAALLSGTLILAPAPHWIPLCAGFEEGSVEWYLFFCYIDPPPKDPHA